MSSIKRMFEEEKIKRELITASADNGSLKIENHSDGTVSFKGIMTITDGKVYADAYPIGKVRSINGDNVTIQIGDEDD